MVLVPGQGTPGTGNYGSGRNLAPLVINPDGPLLQVASDPRLPAGADAVPTPRVDCLHYMTLTDPNGKSVTFVPGEALPVWALPYR